VAQTKRIWLSALIGVAIAGGAWWWHAQDQGTHATGKKDGPRWTLWPGQLPNAAPTLGTEPYPPGMTPEITHGATSPLDTMQPPIFRANSHGDLTIDTQTKNDVERMVALFHGDEALRKLDEFSANIPAKARQELKDLFQNYSQYAQALAQALPPAQSTGTFEEARQQFKVAKELRAQYFGPEKANAMFGEEEAITQNLLTNVESNKDPKMTLNEKIIKAQEEMNKSPGSQP